MGPSENDEGNGGVAVSAVVNNSFERAIKEDSLSESSTKSTTSLSITVWKTGRRGHGDEGRGRRARSPRAVDPSDR